MALYFECRINKKRMFFLAILSTGLEGNWLNNLSYSGTLCEINIDDCESQPCINSTCLDLINNYTCACSPGLSGRNCERVLNECSSQPCQHGKCVKEPNGFSCSCGIGNIIIANVAFPSCIFFSIRNILFSILCGPFSIFSKSS